ncbi:MAG TPA: N-acetylmuramoyl-L-alanine amidase [Desulfobacteraceae bacterium]|nr:N-acetylmuramoyl-L-alanine amidase [Desulfobacteraceae bacterium]
MLIKKKIIFSLFICFIIMISFPGLSSAATARDKYIKAEGCYKKLRNAPEKQKYRCNWFACIDKFNAVFKHNPSGPWAAAGLYMSGKLYLELYKHSYKKSDKQKAVNVFKRIIKRFPKSRYRFKASSKLYALSKSKTKKRVYKKSNNHLKKKKKLKSSTNSKHKKKLLTAKNLPIKDIRPLTHKNTVVNEIRHWSNSSYTRIVIDADNETTYFHRLLKKDAAIHKPQRLYIDLKKSVLANNIIKTIPINDNLLSNVRAGQHTKDSVRVVVDIRSFKTYKIFSLKNPFRIVIDVWGKDKKPVYAKRPPSNAANRNRKIPACTLAKQLALGVKHIVIDPGHGGKDFGAPGYLKGVYEKDITFKIARKLAKKIRKDLNCRVSMTRNSDKYLTLEERTAIANTKNADLFISIHTNAHLNKNAFGIETYFLNLATDNEAILVAARENATSTKNISDLQTILNDLMQNAKVNESSRLAYYVQNSLFENLRKKYRKIKNKGVKQAPFYVLMGAQMPSILIETSFISNPRECKRLTTSKYQDSLCNAVVKGIRKYIIETNPTALLNTNQKKT